jgi:hypothetical protein
MKRTRNVNSHLLPYHYAFQTMDIPDEVVIAPPMIDTALLWIGFEQEATRERLRTEGFDTFDDLHSMKEKDIRDLADSYTRRTVADGRTIFGLKRTRYLIGLIHWVQDFARVGETPSLDGIEDAAQFRAVLDIASYRADVRKVEKDQSDTVSKAADPGKFKNERKWPKWEPAFVNYLSTLPGVNGVPLSYVVREKEMPEPGAEYGSFNEQAVACAPLHGPTLKADSRKVHQLLKSFLQTETAEQWIQPLARRQSGRDDMKALRSHYSGKGNTTRRIADAERARDSLHYKNEKSMPFSTFLDNLQRMFNTFKTEGEEITEPAKVRILLKKVEHPQLQNAVSALRIKAQLDVVTFTDCANHLSSVVSELPDYQSNRKISATDSNKKVKVKHIRGGGGKGGDNLASKRKGIYMPDGSVWTGYYSDWDTMPEKDKNTVMETRKKNKEKGGTPHKKKTPNLKSQIADLKRSIAALKKTSDDDTEDTSDAHDATNNAGDAFGGRSKKKQKKE